MWLDLLLFGLTDVPGTGYPRNYPPSPFLFILSRRDKGCSWRCSYQEYARLRNYKEAIANRMTVDSDPAREKKKRPRALILPIADRLWK
jgi:hypothetical protein